MFVATTNAWAECYVLQSSTEYEIKDSGRWLNDAKNVTYSDPFSIETSVSDLLIFDYKLSGGASITHYITPQYSTTDSGDNFSDIEGNKWRISTKSGSYSTSTDYYEKSGIGNVKIPAGTKRIRFKRTEESVGASKEVYIKNVKITRIISISASTSSLTFLPIELNGTSDPQTISVTYSNIGTTSNITPTNSTDFSISPTSTTFDACTGKATFNITFHPKGTTGGTRTGSFTIAGREAGSTTNKASITINVSGTAKGLPTHTWTGATEYMVDQTINLSELWTSKSSGARTFRVVSFQETGTNNEGSTTPTTNLITSTANGYTLKLSKAGTLKLAMDQVNDEVYSAHSSEITLTIKKHTPTFSWQTPVYFNTTITDYFSTNNKQTAIHITQQTDPEVANLHFNPNDPYDQHTLDLTAYNKINYKTLAPYSTTITVLQDENYYWKEHKATKTITPTYKGNNHVPFTITENNDNEVFIKGSYYGYKWNNGVQVGDGGGGFNYDAKYVIIEFSGIPDKLTFDYETRGVTIDNTTQHNGIFWFVQESEKNDAWDNKEYIWSTTDGNNGKSPSIQLSPTTKYIRLGYWGNFGTAFKNITVTERNELVAVEVADSTKDVTTLAFDSVQVNQEGKLNFALRYANAGYKVKMKMVPDNNHFTISPNHFTNTIGGEFHRTTGPITVTYHPTSDKDNDNCLLIISDEMGDKDTIQITASSYKATQELAWREDFREVEKPFIRLKDGQITNAATASSKLQVTYNSSNNEVITTNSDKTILIPVAAGEATITASQGGNEAWYPAESITKTFIVTDKLLQYIIWNDPLTNLVKSTDNQTIPLTAQVYLQTEDETAPILSPEQTARLTYTSGNSNIVSVQGNQLTIHAVGQTTLTAYVPALRDEYAEATLTVNVIVRPETAGCEDLLLYEQHEQIQFFQYDLYEIIKDPIPLDRTKGVPGYLLFDHYGISWDLVVQYYYAEIRVEESTDNGNNWSNITTVKPVKDQTNQSKIPLSRNATHIRFARNYGGQGYQFLQNIQVFPAQFMEALDAEHRTPITEIDFGQITVGSKEERTFLLDYSNIKYELSPVPSSSEVTATPNTFGVCSGFGTETIKVTWLPTQVNNNATETITFTDPNSKMKSVVILKANVAQGTQNLNWTAPTTINNCNDVDFPTHTTADLPITWTVIEGEEHAQFVDGLLKIYSSGTITIKASHPGTDNYKPFERVYSNIEIIFELIFVGTESDEWENPANWAMCRLPYSTEAITIQAPATLSSHATVQGITFAEGEQKVSLHITPTGGLTVNANGISNAAKDGSSIIIDNTREGAGFLRISPDYQGTMPYFTMRYQTKSTLDDGANKDATWQYIGAPGNNTTIYVDYNTWLYLMDEKTKDGWVLQDRVADVPLNAFAGYAITQYGQPTYEWTAQCTNQNCTIPLTYTKNGRQGRHIFANSYSAPINVKALKGLIQYNEGNESRFRIDETVYIFNSGSWNDWKTHPQTGDDTPGQYYAIPIAAAAANYLSEEQTVIPPMQGFYMRVRSKTPLDQLAETEPVGQIVLDYNTLVMGNDHSMNTAMRAPQHPIPNPYDNLLRIRIQATSANSGTDRVYVIQDEINTNKYNNGYDAPNQETKGLVNIYTNESFGKMEVSCSNNIDSLYIGFMAGEDSLYALHFGAQRGQIYLKDLHNDSIIHMRNNQQYHFTAAPLSTNNTRFQILLLPDTRLDFPTEERNELVSDIHNTIDTPLSPQVWSDGYSIYISNAPIHSTATLFNIGGQPLFTTTLHDMPYTIDISHLPAGVYVLRLNNQAYKFICQ